jgi:hypothetical protein
LPCAKASACLALAIIRSPAVGFFFFIAFYSLLYRLLPNPREPFSSSRVRLDRRERSRSPPQGEKILTLLPW